MLNNKSHIAASSILFLVIVFSYIIMAVKFPLAYIAATYEDFFGEWAQVFFFVTVFILSLRLCFIKSKFRVFFMVLALASFYTFMEEISWGQRIFNISPPEIFLKHNLQRETNIHNFLTGPYSTASKSFLEYALFTGLVLYGSVFPYALTKGVRLARWIESKSLPSPPLYLWPYFVLSAVLELGILSFNEAEIAEILIPTGLSIFLLHYIFTYKSASLSETYIMTPLDSTRSRRLAIAICGIFLLVAIASTGATYGSYSSPRLKSKMDAKFVNGIEKFAGRYKRYEMWDTAIRLYAMMDEKEPGRPSIQRNLAYCYSMTGNTDREKHYIDKAFEIDLEKLNETSRSISTNLSIARTYNQTEKFGKESYHLDRALDIALERVKNKPNSASAAYWLGKTYEQRGNDKSAFKYFEQAFILKPHKKKYRKAYMKARN